MGGRRFSPSEIVYALKVLVRSPLRPERTTVVLWFVMILTHVVIFVAVLPEMLQGQFVGDVNVYSNWATKALEGGGWPVFAHDWVYPAGALLPVMLPKVFGPHLYRGRLVRADPDGQLGRALGSHPMGPTSSAISRPRCSGC